MLVIVAPGQGAKSRFPPHGLSCLASLSASPRGPSSPAAIWCGTAPPPMRTRSVTPRSPSRCSSRPRWPRPRRSFGHIEEACAAVRRRRPGIASVNSPQVPSPGCCTPDDALRLVRVRGEAMARAAAAEPTGMTAILGGDENHVLTAIEANGLTPANVNSPGQIVAAGTTAQLAAFAADPPPGARLRPLQVAGAFHTRHMAPAVDALRAAAADGRGQRPAYHAAVQSRRGRRAHGRRMAGARSSPRSACQCGGTRACGQWRVSGASAFIELPPGRHADRPGPARAAGRGDCSP